MKRAAIYRRISTAHQEDNTSLEGQLSACQRYAEAHGFTIVADFAERASGGTLDRPEFKKLEKLVENREIQAVIVYHQDRLSRNLVDTLLLIKKYSNLGVELHDTTQGEIQDSLLSTITAVLNAEEKQNIRRRTIKGSRDKVASGKIRGNGIAPYGYQLVGEKKNRELVINPEEAQVVRMIVDWSLNGGLGTIRIAARLTEMGIPTPRQKRPQLPNRHLNARPVGEWSNHSILNILKSPAIAGTLYHFRYTRNANGKYTRNNDPSEWLAVPIEPIISQEVFDRLQEKLKANKSTSKRNTKREYLLARRIRCSCGYMMHASYHNGRSVYRCGGSFGDAAKPCRPTVAVYGDLIEPLVWYETVIERVGKEYYVNIRSKIVTKRRSIDANSSCGWWLSEPPETSRPWACAWVSRKARRASSWLG